MLDVEFELEAAHEVLSLSLGEIRHLHRLRAVDDRLLAQRSDCAPRHSINGRHRRRSPVPQALDPAKQPHPIRAAVAEPQRPLAVRLPDRMVELVEERLQGMPRPGNRATAPAEMTHARQRQPSPSEQASQKRQGRRRRPRTPVGRIDSSRVPLAARSRLSPVRLYGTATLAGILRRIAQARFGWCEDLPRPALAARAPLPSRSASGGRSLIPWLRTSRCRAAHAGCRRSSESTCMWPAGHPG